MPKLPTLVPLFVLVACRGDGDQPMAPTDTNSEAKPNVVLIVVDDLGWSDLGVYGSSFYDTPAIDRLAAEGVRFTNFYAASPVCSPTRASLMTGKHPARLDLTNWIGGEQNGKLQQASYVRALPLDELTLGEAFQAAGYATGYVGKWHLGKQGFLPDDQGFETSIAVNQAGQPGSYFAPYENANWRLTDVPDLEGEGYLTDRLTARSLEFVELHQDEPFCLVLSHYAVHTPLQAPNDLVAPYERKAAALGPRRDADHRSEHEADTKLRQDHATYAAMVSSVDASVARIVDKLEQLELSESTIVALVSDNGGLSTLLRSGPNQATSNEPLRSGKGWLYEGGIRVPCIVRFGSRLEVGATVDAPAVTMDLFPTLLELAGVPALPESHVDGTSLARVLRGEPAVPHTSLHWHFPHYHGSGNRPGGAIRRGDWKLVEWFEDDSAELFDLSSDVSERVDLASELPEIAMELAMELANWRQEIGANMPR